MNRRGFSIIELIIVITIMGILLILGVVNLVSTQANGRDAERRADIETIGLQLETYYTSGTDGVGTTGTTATNNYPSTAIIGQEVAMLHDIDTNSLKAPGQTNSSLTAATNNTQTTVGVSPQPTVDQYVYQPIKNDGTLCTGTNECRKFNLYYRLEIASISTDCPSPGFVCMLTSKNQ